MRPLKLASLVAVLMCMSLSACASRRVEETVTIDTTRYTPAADNAQPVAVSAPQLPARDEEMERAGDGVAEAIVRLHKRQNAAALNALSQAEAAINRALRHEPPRSERAQNVLNTTLREIETARHSIQRGAQREALAQLSAVNKRIDALAALEGE